MGERSERNHPRDKEKAKALLTGAAAIYRDLGMPTFLENAEEITEDLLIGKPISSTISHGQIPAEQNKRRE